MKDYVFKIQKFELLLGAYILIALVFFALVGYTDVYNATEYSIFDLRIAADHHTYVNHFRDNRDNLLLYLALWPNFTGPFFVIWLIGDNLISIFIFNTFCFCLSVYIISKTKYFDINKYLILLAINPITFVSLFAVNKEMMALLATSLFTSTLIKPRWYLILFSLFVSFLARKEMTLLFIILYCNFYFFPKWNKYKVLQYCTYIFLISIASYYINENFSAINNYTIEIENTVENGTGGGTILILNNLQNTFGYYLVVLPKTFLNLYGSVLTRTSQMIFFTDVYNDIIVWGQSFLFLYAVPGAFYTQWKTKDKIGSKFFYAFVILCIIFSYIPIVQTRYFYCGYLLLIAVISIKRTSIAKN
ncbi:hypothetical protein IC229_23325 [Spirosoma sp. BT702]|uniref:Uncharacterized protein n=1 Tax=Spirosoma profusum TaxID=2771354 RepID=A0A926Y4R2_9BACT|nr:hypothetical protein [Spirosoma profusum]MBD2703595.1 hypothetical protein [Spirosoma profusum]